MLTRTRCNGNQARGSGDWPWENEEGLGLEGRLLLVVGEGEK